MTPVLPSLLTHIAGKLLTSGVKVKHSCQQVSMWDDTEKGWLTLYFSQSCQLPDTDNVLTGADISPLHSISAQH